MLPCTALNTPSVLYGSPSWSRQMCQMCKLRRNVRLSFVFVWACNGAGSPLKHHHDHTFPLAFYSSLSSQFRPVISNNVQSFFYQHIGKAYRACFRDEKWHTQRLQFSAIVWSCSLLRGLTALSASKNSSAGRKLRGAERCLASADTQTHKDTPFSCVF